MDETGLIKANSMAQNGSKIGEISVMNKKENNYVHAQIDDKPQQSSSQIE